MIKNGTTGFDTALSHCQYIANRYDSLLAKLISGEDLLLRLYKQEQENGLLRSLIQKHNKNWIYLPASINTAKNIDFAARSYVSSSEEWLREALASGILFDYENVEKRVLETKQIVMEIYNQAEPDSPIRRAICQSQFISAANS